MELTDAEKTEFLQAMVCAVQTNTPSVTNDEVRWVRLAIQREAERAALRKAIIDKSLTGLVWMFLLALGKVFYEYALSHGWKP